MSKQGLTEQQVKWASQHDWFVREQVWNEQLSVVVEATLHNAELGYYTEQQEFADFQELRDWAGY